MIRRGPATACTQGKPSENSRGIRHAKHHADQCPAPPVHPSAAPLRVCGTYTRPNTIQCRAGRHPLRHWSSFCQRHLSAIVPTLRLRSRRLGSDSCSALCAPPVYQAPASDKQARDNRARASACAAGPRLKALVVWDTRNTAVHYVRDQRLLCTSSA